MGDRKLSMSASPAGTAEQDRLPDILFEAPVLAAHTQHQSIRFRLEPLMAFRKTELGADSEDPSSQETDGIDERLTSAILQPLVSQAGASVYLHHNVPSIDRRRWSILSLAEHSTERIAVEDIISNITDVFNGVPKEYRGRYDLGRVAVSK